MFGGSRTTSKLHRHRGAIALAATDAKSTPDKWKHGPVEVFTPAAQKVLYLMKANPELVDTSIEQELERLTEQRDQELREEEQQAEVAEKDALVLRSRVKEVREKERTRVVTELLYLKVCQTFIRLETPLVDSMQSGGVVSFGKNVKLEGLYDIYSKDALELVREHLFQIIGQNSDMAMSVVQIALFQAGQVYAMSVLFGYYVRRVDARYQLEKLLNSNLSDGDGDGLKFYVSNFGPDEMTKMTKIASAEAQLAMERQVSALFGDLRDLKEKLLEAVGMVASNQEASMKLQEAIENQEVQSMRITSSDLKRMVLEAVAFGALLYDSEKQVDGLYELTPSGRTDTLGGDDIGSRMLPE